MRAEPAGPGTMHMVRAFAAAALLGLLACAPSTPAATESADGTVPLTIVTDSGAHRYQVEVARTADEQARGLMYRQEMAADRGMIFPFTPPRPASFWMKNTYVPLDMIFVGTDGRIESVAADTVPLTMQSYTSQGVVAAVLELNAGEAARIGAGPGDRVDYQLSE